MLNIRNEILWQDPLTNLTRFNLTISGLNQNHEVVEVDTRNNLFDKVHSHMNEDYQFPHILDCKYLKTSLGHTYFFSLDKKIVSMEGQIVEESNSKANFSQGLDAIDDIFIFGKFHTLHNKYSLNVTRVGKDKKIIKLLDDSIQKINLVAHDKSEPMMMVETQNSVWLQHGQNWEHELIFEGVNRYQIDHNYVYTLGRELTNNSPRKNGSLEETEKKHTKVRVEAYKGQKLIKGKGYSEFQFTLPRYPTKMDSFNSDLIIVFEDSIEIYDIRKVIKPFQKQNLNRVYDFYYEPNLQRIYVSSQRGLHIYQYK